MSLRAFGLALMFAALVAHPLSAATSTTVTPPPGSATPAAPPTSGPAAALPAPPSSSSAASALPTAIVPSPTPAVPAPQHSSAPLPVGTPVPEGSDTEKSVVQIFTSFQEPNWSAPWIFDLPHRASGTGFLIDGNRIMTNAHVVAWTQQLLVRR